MFAGRKRKRRAEADGSDTNFEFTCAPCEDIGMREGAVKYCPECHTYLCTSCTRRHGRIKATKSHKLLSTDDTKTGSMLATSKCRHHPDRDIEMYCGTHDMVYCTLCIASVHRSCSGVKRIEDESKSSAQHTEVQHLLDETKIAQERMKALVGKKQKNIDAVEVQRSATEGKIEEIELSLIEHIRTLKREMKNSLAIDCATLKNNIESEISAATHMIQDLDISSKQLQTVSSMDFDSCEQFVQVKLTRKTVSEANMLYTKSESDDTKSVVFAENTDLVKSVMTAAALGHMCTQAQAVNKQPTKPVQYKVESYIGFNVKLESDKSICSINDVCHLPDGTLLLTDQANKSVKRLDTNYNIKDHCDLDSIPTGICCIDETEVAVKMLSRTIQFLSVASTLCKTRCIEIVGGDHYGLAYRAGELWSSRSCGVNVYSTTGVLIKSVDEDREGKAIFQPIVQHLAVSGDSVIVTDFGDGAVCLNIDGSVKGEFRDSRLNTTRGVCVSVDGTVFLSGYYSNNILMFSSDGKCLGEVLPIEANLRNILSLNYDKNKHCIIVTCDKYDAIHVVDFSD